MHFFSPANVMKLLEVVRGTATAKDVLATTMKLAKSLKKTAVVWGNLDSLRVNQEQIYAVGKSVPGFGALAPISYDAIGTVDWNLVAQQVISSGATAK